MPAPPQRMAWAILCAAAALFGTGCAPAGLDAQQQRAESRECASLLERHVAHRTPTGAIVVDGYTIDLGRDPAHFYDVLAARRGPSAFPLKGGSADTDTRASFVSDLCKARDASTIGSSKTTTTTSTSLPDAQTGTGG